MSHGFYKGYSREGDIQKMSRAWDICAYGSNWETNGGHRGILSNVIATGDIQWKWRPVRKVNWSCVGNGDIRYNKINIIFFTGWHGRSSPPRSTMFPQGDNLPCHPVKNVVFISCLPINWAIRGRHEFSGWNKSSRLPTNWAINLYFFWTSLLPTNSASQTNLVLILNYGIFVCFITWNGFLPSCLLLDPHSRLALMVEWKSIRQGLPQFTA